MASLNLRRFSEPDSLRGIEPRRLTAFFEPWRTYLKRRGLVFSRAGKAIDYEQLAAILMSPDADVPREMVDALYYVHETAAHEDMDALLEVAAKQRIPIDKDMLTTVADVAIQVWLAAPELLRQHHAEVVAFRQRNFLYYGGIGSGPQSMPPLDTNLSRRIEATLDDWFESHRRGRQSRIFFFPREEKVWMLVRHGMPMRREASHSDDGETATEFYRPQQHDVLIYDPEADELGVHASTKGEVKLYCSCLGRFLFGDEDHFPRNDKYTLEPLLEDGAACLRCEDIDGLDQLRLVEIRRFWGGAYQEVEIRRATDLFEALAARDRKLASGGKLVSATFKAKFTDSPKERSITIRVPGNARYERNEDSEPIDRWLARRGFILNPVASEDDEESAKTSLEGVG